MKVKRRYTRIELTQTAQPGPHEWQCVLCRGLGYRLTDIGHAEDCPLADASVTSVVVIVSRAGIVLRRADGKYWWVSASSGKTYDIERRGQGRTTYWILSEHSTGRHVMDDVKLSDIRKRLQEHQGNL